MFEIKLEGVRKRAALLVEHAAGGGDAELWILEKELRVHEIDNAVSSRAGCLGRSGDDG